MVVDLTNSSRYYSADSDGTSEFQYSSPDHDPIYHRKVQVLLKLRSFTPLSFSILVMTLPGVQIPCRGRGQAPQPDAVNEFCWTITAFNQYGQPAHGTHWTIVHCTHGFNRTGKHVQHMTVIPVPSCSCLPSVIHSQRAICKCWNQTVCMPLLSPDELILQSWSHISLTGSPQHSFCHSC